MQNMPPKPVRQPKSCHSPHKAETPQVLPRIFHLRQVPCGVLDGHSAGEPPQNENSPSVRTFKVRHLRKKIQLQEAPR